VVWEELEGRVSVTAGGEYGSGCLHPKWLVTAVWLNFVVEASSWAATWVGMDANSAWKRRVLIA
jgi:hypothetical protein